MRFDRTVMTLLSAALFCSTAAAQSGVQGDLALQRGEGLTVTTLGTGTPGFSFERSRPATLVSHENLHVLVDAGTGTVWDPVRGFGLDGPLQGEILNLLPGIPAVEDDVRTFWPGARMWPPSIVPGE